jgi:hypothetical protein
VFLLRTLQYGKQESITRIPRLLPGIKCLRLEDVTNITKMSRELRCAFFAGFVQVETLALESIEHGNMNGNALTDTVASLP